MSSSGFGRSTLLCKQTSFCSRIMVLKKLLCVINVMTLISLVYCVLPAGYGKDKTCERCKYQTALERGHATEEDLFHLKHADPCQSDANTSVKLCEQLVALYLGSELHTGGDQPSKCKGLVYKGCYGVGLDKGFYCTVHNPNTTFYSGVRLSECVEGDFKRYRDRTRVRGAQFPLHATSEIQQMYGSLNIAPRRIGKFLSSGSSRSRSQSPPPNQGRTSSFRAVVGSHLRRRSSRRSPSQGKSPNSAWIPPRGKFKWQ